MKVIVTGSTGYVGQEYVKYLTDLKINCVSLSRAHIDYTDPDILRLALIDHKPDFLINAAGYTGKPNVDACELNKSECLQGNAVFPGHVAKVCQELDIPWGHVSSGCIYTGGTGSGWTEDDEPNFSFRQSNCSWYSGTKALGEDILRDYDNCYIWRLRIPFDHNINPRNYITKLLTYDKLLDAENSVSHLQEFIFATVKTWMSGAPYGIYNVTNPGSITTRQVVDIIKQYVDKEFKFFNDSDSFYKVAKTPRSNCIMDSSKLAEYDIKMTPVRECIGNAVAKMYNIL